MKVGLIDVDGHSNFPNLALMKISSYHKARGDQVEWALPILRYDTVYQSKVFDFTPDYNTYIECENLIKGGSGYDLDNKLPTEIECMCPDYSLYNTKNIAYGFLTRGCPRNCPFCIVGKKEGLKSLRVADLRQFWKSQKEIKLLDPNLLACSDHIKLLQQLIDSKAQIDFTQGLDARLLTEDNISQINQLKIKEIHFAWDFMAQSDTVIKGLRLYADNAIHKPHGQYAIVYVLTNFNTKIEEDLQRIYKLKELGYNPFVMIYDKQHAPKQAKRLARWVNNKFIFRACEKFEDYQKR